MMGWWAGKEEVEEEEGEEEIGEVEAAADVNMGWNLNAIGFVSCSILLSWEEKTNTFRKPAWVYLPIFPSIIFCPDPL